MYTPIEARPMMANIVPMTAARAVLVPWSDISTAKVACFVVTFAHAFCACWWMLETTLQGRDIPKGLAVDVRQLGIVGCLQLCELRKIVQRKPMKRGELGHIEKTNISNNTEIVLGQVQLSQVEELLKLVIGPGNVTKAQQLQRRRPHNGPPTPTPLPTSPILTAASPTEGALCLSQELGDLKK
ncbi:hypothetical protein EYF80_030197 [Liparis tanakae]|uniref:Uncharacterized protein n=1 Tax=Liparis tanakae TaxID=230148 RepID=A0A4Z2H2T8_9TELE|nr:hypothetical protein EYF80_030197 [Liparis tanakae]